MASVSEIPWLRPARTLQAIEAGASAGGRRASLETSANEAAARNALQAQAQANALQMEQERTQAEMVRAQMELDARQKAHEASAIKENQQIQIENARKQTELGIRQSQLKEAQNRAARHFAAQQKFTALVQSGMPPEKAIFQTPELMTPGIMESSISASRKSIPKMSPSDYYANSPIMQKEEQDTLNQIESGVPPLKAIQNHPTLIQNTPFSSKWGPIYRQEIEHAQRTKEKAALPAKEPSVSILANQRKSLDSQLNDTNLKLPKETKQAIKDQIFKIDTQLNAGKPPSPTEDDIAHLKSNPETRDTFEKYYGPADQYLNPQVPAGEPPPQ